MDPRLYIPQHHLRVWSFQPTPHIPRAATPPSEIAWLPKPLVLIIALPRIVTPQCSRPPAVIVEFRGRRDCWASTMVDASPAPTRPSKGGGNTGAPHQGTPGVMRIFAGAPRTRTPDPWAVIPRPRPPSLRAGGRHHPNRMSRNVDAVLESPALQPGSGDEEPDYLSAAAASGDDEAGRSPLRKLCTRRFSACNTNSLSGLIVSVFERGLSAVSSTSGGFVLHRRQSRKRRMYRRIRNSRLTSVSTSVYRAWRARPARNIPHLRRVRGGRRSVYISECSSLGGASCSIVPSCMFETVFPMGRRLTFPTPLGAGPARMLDLYNLPQTLYRQLLAALEEDAPVSIEASRAGLRIRASRTIHRRSLQNARASHYVMRWAGSE
ncbi:hypothetical protein R3P38DRAFT_971194 [Favolaschia claudopus]|uniref:Uncharacterized protein n=1 Tax=Favolaschia claudopus TaxID=2862362 RepID=A0AAW0E7G0_9AGAR